MASICFHGSLRPIIFCGSTELMMLYVQMIFGLWPFQLLPQDTASTGKISRWMKFARKTRYFGEILQALVQGKKNGTQRDVARYLSMEFCVNIILLTVKLSHRWRERPPSVWHGGVVAGFWFLGLDVLPGGRVHMMGYLHVWFHAVACMVMSRSFWLKRLKPLGPLSFSWRRTKGSSRGSNC